MDTCTNVTLKSQKARYLSLMIHHAGKGGNQRGTSRREDILDTIIKLKHPADYSAEDGARFHVLLEKARDVHGDDAKPFEAKLEVRDEAAYWTLRDLDVVDMDRIVDLTREGLTCREIADETGIPKSRVNRMQSKARADGALE